MNVYSQWFNYAANGTWETSYGARACLIRNLIARNSTQVFNEPTGTFYLRAVANEVSAAGFTLIGGVDNTSAELFGSVTLPFVVGSSTTTQLYTCLPLIEKAVTTYGVSLYSVNEVTAVETLLCVYAPGETVPEYKRYLVPGANDGDTFSALCKLAYVPAVADTDAVIPGVLGALKLGLMALQFEDKNDMERAVSYMNSAIGLLDADRQELDGAEEPPFNVSTNYGAGNIVNVM